MKKTLHLNWLKWLPIVGNIFFLVLFILLTKKNEGVYDKEGYRVLHNTRDMLHWFDFFTTSGYVTLFVSIICSFFIKNKWLKWLSVITGLMVLVYIYMHVGSFNPY
jgi:predicted small integral membrane protein